MNEQKKIRVFVIDDHQIVREGLKSLIKDVPSLDFCGESSADKPVEPDIETSFPDVVLLDMFLPKPDGINICQKIKEQFNYVKVVILSGNTEEDLISGAFRAGANGYIQKDISREELIEAIEAVFEGETFLSRFIESQLSQGFLHRARYGEKYAASKLNSLSEREVEIIRLFAQGLSYKEIAAELEISTRTVEAHKTHILDKLELKTVIDIVKYAIRNRLIDLE